MKVKKLDSSSQAPQSQEPVHSDNSNDTGEYESLLTRVSRDRLQYRRGMMSLFLKAALTALGWQVFSDIYTFNPNDIPTGSREFAKYSSFTGLGAGIGMVAGMVSDLKLAQYIFKEPDGVLTRKSRIQGMQLFVDAFLTDGFWGLFYRGFRAAGEKNNLLQGVVGWIPLSFMGLLFVGVSKIVHTISLRCISSKDISRDSEGLMVEQQHASSYASKWREISFNPQWDLALVVGIGLGEIGFLFATLLSSKYNILDGAIESVPGAVCVDALLAGAMAGFCAVLPYLFLLVKSFAAWPEFLPSPETSGFFSGRSSNYTSRLNLGDNNSGANGSACYQDFSSS